MVLAILDSLMKPKLDHAEETLMCAI